MHLAKFPDNFNVDAVYSKRQAFRANENDGLLGKGMRAAG